MLSDKIHQHQTDKTSSHDMTHHLQPYSRYVEATLPLWLRIIEWFKRQQCVSRHHLCIASSSKHQSGIVCQELYVNGRLVCFLAI